MFARDVRKQAERVMAQSTASMLPDSRRQVPPAPLSAGLHGTPALHEDTHHSALAAQRRIAELQEELKAAKYEAERQVRPHDSAFPSLSRRVRRNSGDFSQC